MAPFPSLSFSFSLYTRVFLLLSFFFLLPLLFFFLSFLLFFSYYYPVVVSCFGFRPVGVVMKKPRKKRFT